jgi:hypothetical protein
MLCISIEVKNHATGSKEAGSLLKLIDQLTSKFPEVLERATNAAVAREEGLPAVS